jgi:hypothetical protein
MKHTLGEDVRGAVWHEQAQRQARGREGLLRTDSPFLRAVIYLVLILLCILSNVSSETSSPATANSIARPLTTTFNNVNLDQQVPLVPRGHSDISAILTSCGEPSTTVVDRYPVPGFTRYGGQVYFAARSSGESADHDIDNINVPFLYEWQSAVTLSDTCYPSTEIDGSQLITVTRIGSLSNTVSITYTTMNATAIADVDYTATSGILTFGPGEHTKVISVPILNDLLDEGEEGFLISLGNPSGTVIAGPSTAKLTIADDERGLWSPVIELPIVPIHMSLLPDARIMMWDRHSHEFNWNGDPQLWNPATNTFTTAALPDFELFCSGHSFLPDGRLFVTGGHIGLFIGEKKARIYDPINDTWDVVPDMNAGRWYPSNLTLANGDVVVMGGTRSSLKDVNSLTQVWQSSSNRWRTLTDAPLGAFPNYADLYPWIFLAPDGQVFVAGPQRTARYLDVLGAGRWVDGPSSSLSYRDYGSAVMFGNSKIMIVGGNPRDYNEASPTITPTASVEIIDLNADNPSWQIAQSMSFGRRHHIATALPDGKVLVTGGSSLPGFDNVAGAVLYPEMYDPTRDAWLRMSPHTRYRGYHSNAMLLPDGRVLVAGGGHPEPRGGSEETNAEIYSPPYLFRGSRPIIDCAPSQIAPNQPFFIATSDAISRVTLIRLPSATHSFNQDQVFHELAFTQTIEGLETKLPPNPNVVPPGYYMLFIVNDTGVPSVAKIVQVGAIHQYTRCMYHFPLIVK